MKTYKYKFCVGDWSLDGHEKRVYYTVDSSLTSKELDRAYEFGVKKLNGVDISNLCKGFEAHTVNKNAYETFKNAGYVDYAKLHFAEEDNEFLESNEEKPEKFYVGGSEGYLKLFLFTCHLGNPEAYIEYIQNERELFNAGGYGVV